MDEDVWAIGVRWQGSRLFERASAYMADAAYSDDDYLNIEGERINPSEPSGMMVLYIAQDIV